MKQKILDQYHHLTQGMLVCNQQSKSSDGIRNSYINNSNKSRSHEKSFNSMCISRSNSINSEATVKEETAVHYFWFKYDLDKRNTTFVLPNQCSNPWPPDHEQCISSPWEAVILTTQPSGTYNIHQLSLSSLEQNNDKQHPHLQKVRIANLYKMNTSNTTNARQQFTTRIGWEHLLIITGRKQLKRTGGWAGGC